MLVVVNGEERRLEPGTTVAGLVEHLGLSKAACAVEVNRRLVPKKEHGQSPLREGDKIEVVTLVGGG
jgi:sulfur carrier protein